VLELKLKGVIFCCDHAALFVAEAQECTAVKRRKIAFAFFAIIVKLMSHPVDGCEMAIKFAY